MDVLALIGAVAGVISTIGVPIAYLQLRNGRATKERQAAIDSSLAARLDGLTLFAPSARYLGSDVDLVDRRTESATLLAQVKAGRSVLAIEGIVGAGKTALAARLCRLLGGRWKVRWVFCDEKGTSLTLTTLAKALASSTNSSSARRLQAGLARPVSPSDVADAVIDVLAAQRLLLVLDNYHAVTDSGINELIVRLEHSKTASTVVLTSRTRLELRAVPLVGQLELSGLSVPGTRALLRHRGVPLSEDAAKIVWERAGNGNPLALTLFAGRARHTDPDDLALHLPSLVGSVTDWIALAFDELAADDQTVAKIIAFAYEPMPRDALQAVAAPVDPREALTSLASRFLVRERAGRFEMHNAVRDYITQHTSGAEQTDLAARFTDYYQGQARTVFVDGLGRDEPSYGTLYLESFPDYVSAVDRHIRLVDDLLDRLADSGLALARGDKILVLGSGDGTHDPGFAKHGLDITNVEIQPEIADLGRTKAAALPAQITYLVTDMTEPLPPDVGDRSMDAVFNIGSSFGYESSDETNAMVFRNAAKSLRDGAPFVFEYVNGPYWESKRVQRQVDVTPLPNGSTRTEVSVTNPDARTSLTLIGLQRPDGTGGWFRHFMRYYRVGEIIAMMEKAGLRPVAIYGATAGRVTGQPFDEQQAEAMVIIATPARDGGAGPSLGSPHVPGGRV